MIIRGLEENLKHKIRDIAKKLFIQKRNLKYQDRRLVDFLLQWIEKMQYKSVLLFLPLEHEVDLFPLVKALRQRGITVFAPKIKAEEMEIVSVRLPLKRGAFQIWESSSSLSYFPKFDLALIPILAFDCKMRRIGFGKGYYDRFFTKSFLKPYIIFLSRHIVFSSKKITQDYDIQANMVLTHKSRFESKGKKDAIFRSKPYCLSSCWGGRTISYL